MPTPRSATPTPGLMGTAFDSSRNDALFGAEPLDVVTWSVEPTISPGALEAAGTLSGGAMLFDPTVDGEGASFAVYYKDHNEPMVLLLPNLGPMYIWDTNHTVAEMDYEFEGSSFTIRAYSPLFMDVGPDDPGYPRVRIRRRRQRRAARRRAGGHTVAPSYGPDAGRGRPGACGFFTNSIRTAPRKLSAANTLNGTMYVP